MTCKFCSKLNYKSALRCSSCKKMLFTPEEALLKLQEKQELLESRFEIEFKELKKDIQIISQLIQSDKQSTESSLEKSKPIPSITENPIYKESLKTAALKEKLSVELPKPEPAVLKEVSIDTKSTVSKEIKSNEKVVSKNVPTPKETLVNKPPLIEKEVIPQKTKEPSVIGQKIKEYLTPIYDGVDLLEATYKKYKKEGKLPIFFMTIAGIAAILVGCGYLMQISFNTLGIYEDVVKIGLGFAFSLAIGFIGLRLNKKDHKYKEYSSALISLTLILNYLFIYFLAGLSDFNFLSSAQFGFFLIVANTGLAIWMALKYETKIIAVLSLLGGSLAPFYLNSSGDFHFYFGYLFVLLLASNYIALSIKWYKLNYISFVLYLVLVESTVFSGVPLSTLFIVYLHLFAYLFFYIVLFNGKKLKETFSKNDLAILAGNLSVFLINLHQTIPDFLVLGFVYLCNGILFSGLLFVFWKTIQRKVKVGLFITIGAFLGLAIPFLFGQELMGLFWSIEAIMLVSLGFVFRMPIIRKEGYLVLGIAISKLGYQSFKIIENWNQSVFHDGFLNYVILGAVIGGLWFLSIRFKSELEAFESRIFNICKEILPIWFSSVVFILGFHFIEEYVLNIMWVFVFGLIYWSKYFQTKTTETFGYLHLSFVVLGFVWSVMSVNSPSFSDQTLGGKISLIQLMITFGVLRLFYEKVIKTQQKGYKMAYAFRVLFFLLIPLIFVKQVYKHIDQYFEISIWIALLISYGLHRKFKHKAIFLEFYFFAIIGLTFSILNFSSLNMGVGISTLILLLILEKVELEGVLKLSKHSVFLQFIPYLCFGLITFTVHEFGWMNEKNSLLLFSTLVGCFLLVRKSELVKSTYSLGYIVGIIFGILGSLLSIGYIPNFVSVGLSTLVLILYVFNNIKKTIDTVDSKQKFDEKDNILVSIILGLIVYTQFLILFLNFGLSLVFVVLTIIGLFFWDKRNLKSEDKTDLGTKLMQHLNIILFLNIILVLIGFKIVNLGAGLIYLSLLLSVYLLVKKWIIKVQFSKVEFNMAYFIGFTGLGYYLVQSNQNSTLVGFISIIVLIIGSMIFEKNSNEKIIKQSHVFLYHVFVLMTYSSILLVVGYSILSPVMTILLVIHAIILLFSGLKQQNKMLNKLSLVWFISVLLKVVFHDIRDFSGTMKIVVLIVLGILLLGASYGYVKIKEKYMPLNDEPELDENPENGIEHSPLNEGLEEDNELGD